MYPFFIAFTIGALILFCLLVLREFQDAPELDIWAAEMPKPEVHTPADLKVKMKVWTVNETIIAAFLAIYGESIFTRPLAVIARGIGRTEGSLLGKINRLKTINGIEQAISKRGRRNYEMIKVMGRAKAFERFCTAMIEETEDNIIKGYFLEQRLRS